MIRVGRDGSVLFLCFVCSRGFFGYKVFRFLVVRLGLFFWSYYGFSVEFANFFEVEFRSFYDFIFIIFYWLEGVTRLSLGVKGEIIFSF